jgi:hypothetical protein
MTGRRRLRAWLTEEVRAADIFHDWRLILAGAVLFILLNLPFAIFWLSR